MADPSSLAVTVALQVAATAISLALAPNTEQFGPRLKDKRLTTSGYGNPIPLGFGTIRMSGEIIWGLDIIERQNTTNQGKGLGPSNTFTEYLYYGTWAIAFAERESVVPLTIRANGIKVWDSTAEDGESQTLLEGFNFRWYDGSNDQEPDPAIVADKGEYAPAYRGISYMVIEEMPLINFGNALPQIEVDVAFKAKPQPKVATQLEGGANNNAKDFVYDAVTNYSYSLLTGDAGSPLVASKIAVHDTRTGEELLSRDVSDIVQESGLLGLGGNNLEVWETNTLVGALGPYLFFHVGTSSYRPLIAVRKNTLTGVSYFGVSGDDGFVDTTYGGDDFLTQRDTGELPWARKATVLGIPTLSAGVIYFIAGGFGGEIVYDGSQSQWILKLGTNEALEFVWGEGVDFGGACVGVLPGKAEAGFGEFYFLNRSGTYNSGTPITIRKVRVAATASFLHDSRTTIGVEAPVVLYTYSSTVNDGFPYAVYDSSDDTLIIHEAGKVLKINTTDGSVIWEQDNLTEGASPPTGIDLIGDGPSDLAVNRVNGLTFAVPGPSIGLGSNRDYYALLDAETGEVVDEFDIRGGEKFTDDQVVFPSTTSYVWDPVRNRMILLANGANDGPVVLYRERNGPGTEDLADIVSELCQRGILTADQLDVSELVGIEVKGYKISRQMNIREALFPLSVAYAFDGFETGTKIKFKLRTGEVAVTVDQRDLMQLEEGDYFPIRREHDLKIPMQVTTQHYDADKDYQEAAQVYKRAQTPFKTMYSNSELSIELPLVLTPTEGIQISERIVIEKWLERDIYRLKVPRKYMHIEPHDVIRVLGDDLDYTLRVENITLGAGRVMEIEGVRTDTYIYDYAAIGVIPPGPTITDPLANKAPRNFAFLLDIPLLRDFDNAVGGGVVYTGMAREGAEQNDFRAGSVYVTGPDGVYERKTKHTQEVPWGIVTVPPPDIPNPEYFAVQEATLTIRMFQGLSELASSNDEGWITRLENRAILVKGDGSPEIIGFRDVIDNEDGTYTLSGLVRGRRGTETLAYDHRSGEYFVLIKPVALNAYVEPLSRLDTNVKAVALAGSDQGFNDFVVAPQNLKLRSLTPRAPVQITRVDDGSNINLSWVRRDRIEERILPITGNKILSETSEQYRVEIFDDEDGTNTLVNTVVSTNSYVYTGAVADFGSVPELLYVRIRQISTAVGDGFGLIRGVRE